MEETIDTSEAIYNDAYTVNGSDEEEAADYDTEHIQRRGPVELSIIERLEYGITQQQEELEKPEINYPKSLEMDKLYLTGKKELLHLEGWMKETGIYKRYFFEFLFKIALSIVARSSLVGRKHKNWDEVFGLLALCSLLHVFKSFYFYKRSAS